MYDWLLNILSILFVLVAIGFCILAHEFGHFLAAKWRGLQVDSFALGFRPFFRKKYRGVEYRIGYLPFGGYCEIPQIDATDEVPVSADGRQLPRAKAVDRIITAFAGPLFNILSGLLIGCVVWYAGLPQASPKMRSMEVAAVDPEGPEYAAGLRPGDRIIRINGKEFFCTWEEFCKEVVFSVDGMTLGIERGKEKTTITYIPRGNAKLAAELSKENIAMPFFSVIVPIQLDPTPGSPAAIAGILPGDQLLMIDGERMTNFADYQLALDRSGGRPIEMLIKRGDAELKFSVAPVEIPDLGGDFSRWVIDLSMREKAGAVEVATVGKNGPAAQAGIQSGDVLIKLDGAPLENGRHLPEKLQAGNGRPIHLVWLRDGREMSAPITPVRRVPRTIGAEISLWDHPTPIDQLVSTWDMTWKSLRGIAVGIGHRLGLTEKQSTLRPSHMSGPLGIAVVLFDSVRHHSLIYGIYFVVVISFALAIFNLLPLPVLDGGHILFGVVELIFRRPVPSKIVRSLSIAFAVLLVGLMIFVTFADGRRLYRKYAPEEQQK